MARDMFSTETVRTEQWYRITYTDAHGNTCTVERPDAEAASYAAAVSETPGCDLVKFERCAS